MRGRFCSTERTVSVVPNNNIALARAMLTSVKALGRLVQQSFALLVVGVAHQMIMRGFSIFSKAASDREAGDRNSVLNSTYCSSSFAPSQLTRVTGEGVWNARRGCYSSGLHCATTSALTLYSRRNGAGKLWMDTGIFFVFCFFCIFFISSSHNARFSLPRSCISELWFNPRRNLPYVPGYASES